ncbi:MAG: hypothetical protein EOM65_12940, partial [Synergistales bacterium]|nr:hypothetical protein [Synergistales bacterium]
MITTTKPYNGWKNYETWNVVLWISNDEGLYLSARDFMKTYRGLKPYRDWLRYMGEDLPRYTPDGVDYRDFDLSLKEL